MDSTSVNTLFLKHLNRLHCAKAHFVERLTEIGEYARFSDLKHLLTTALQRSEKQLARLDMIYTLLGAAYTFTSCQDLIDFVENAFNEVLLNSGEDISNSEGLLSRNIAVLFYLGTIESAELDALRLLAIIAGKMNAPSISSLIQKCQQEALIDSTVTRRLITDHLES